MAMLLASPKVLMAPVRDQKAPFDRKRWHQTMRAAILSWPRAATVEPATFKNAHGSSLLGQWVKTLCFQGRSAWV